MQTFLVFTCVRTRREFDVINVEELTAETAEQAANDLKSAIADEADSITMYNNCYTVTERDGETINIVASSVKQFMQCLSADANLVYDVSFVQETIHSILD